MKAKIRIIVVLLAILGVNHHSKSQDCINIEYRNVVPTGCSSGSDQFSGFTFEIWASAAACYTGNYADYAGFNLRMDINVGTNNIAANPTNTINPAAVTSGSALRSVPGNPPAGSSELGLTFSRDAQPDLVTAPVLLGTIAVSLVNPISSAVTITTRTATTTPGSFYSNVAQAGQSLGMNEQATADIISCAALPVSLLNFDAKKEGNIAILNWATTWETNSDYFEVQQSSNARNWFGLGKVYSAGDSKDSRAYTFTDEFPVQGQNYYRLRMVDKDGSESVSKTRLLTFENGTSAVVYPNPAKSNVSIKGVDLTKVVKVSFLSTDGKELLTFSNPQQLNIASLSNGIYFVKILEKNGGSHTSKVVINR